MNAREQRGLAIAALCKLNRTPEGWLVPSQSGERIYNVDVNRQTCSCPDYTESGFKCKHLHAVEFTIKREVGTDGTISETRTLTFTETKKYTQSWPQYNLAQATEKKRFMVLLQDLCKNLPDPEHNKPGPKPHRVRDMIFAMAYKVYSGFSARRFSCDLADAHADGFLTRAVPGMKVTAFHEDVAMTPILMELIHKSATPLRAVETDFAVDSSGFSTSRFERWFDAKYGVTKRTCVWVKVHIACGVKTNVITAVRVLGKDTGDCPQFIPLMKTTRERFDVKEVSADKAYLSVENVDDVVKHGGTPFIMPKANTTGGIGGLFEKMVRYFECRQADFLNHYHKRSNVESTFSMCKRKFGDSVRSKTDAAMVNEVLCKLLCHNLCCLIMEQEVLGIAPVFWPEESIAHAGQS
jgi:transposase